MRLQLSIVIAFCLLTLLLLVIARPIHADLAESDVDFRSITSFLGNSSVQFPVTATSTVTPGSASILPTATITLTMTPIITPTITVMPGSGITDEKSGLIFLPAFLDGFDPSGSGNPQDPCSPNLISLPSGNQEPTSTPPPTSTPAPSSTPIATSTITPTLMPTGILSSTVCPPNPQELALAELIIYSPLQERTTMTYNPILAQVAKNHAIDMAIRGYFGSVDPNGIGPNHRVKQAGYPLPDYYSPLLEANNIESITAGRATAADVFATVSNVRNSHVFGTEDGYRLQNEYGIGYAYVEDSVHVYYWVILIAIVAEETNPEP